VAAGLAIGLAVLAPCATVLATPPDEPAPPEIAPELAAAKHAIVHGLDRGWTRARYIGLETRDSDQLVVLRFEIYGWPNFAPMRAYLVSRCRSLAEIDPRSMSGGIVAGDFATDPELEYIRSSAQPSVVRARRKNVRGSVSIGTGRRSRSRNVPLVSPAGATHSCASLRSRVRRETRFAGASRADQGLAGRR
jgi:hypothetical protein